MTDHVRGSIRPERLEDCAAVRRVNELAFKGPNEAALVDALRAARAVVLSLVAVEQGDIVGHILFTPVEIASGSESVAAVGLAPMAVLPSHQGRGIGSELVRQGLAELRRADHDIVVVLGHPEYYPRFGFRRASGYDVRWERAAPDEAFMLLELRSGALRGRGGIARYHRAFKKI